MTQTFHEQPTKYGLLSEAREKSLSVHPEQMMKVVFPNPYQHTIHVSYICLNVPYKFNQPNVGEYTIHGWCGKGLELFFVRLLEQTLGIQFARSQRESYYLQHVGNAAKGTFFIQPKRTWQTKTTTLFSNHLVYLRNLYMFSTITLKSPPPPGIFLRWKCVFFFPVGPKHREFHGDVAFVAGFCIAAVGAAIGGVRLPRVARGTGGHLKPPTWRGPGVTKKMYETLVKNGNKQLLINNHLVSWIFVGNINKFVDPKKKGMILFLSQSWKWKLVPSNMSFLSFRVIFPFHDYGREGIVSKRGDEI